MPNECFEVGCRCLPVFWPQSIHQVNDLKCVGVVGVGVNRLVVRCIGRKYQGRPVGAACPVGLLRLFFFWFGAFPVIEPIDGDAKRTGYQNNVAKGFTRATLDVSNGTLRALGFFGEISLGEFPQLTRKNEAVFKCFHICDFLKQVNHKGVAL